MCLGCSWFIISLDRLGRNADRRLKWIVNELESESHFQLFWLYMDCERKQLPCTCKSVQTVVSQLERCRRSSPKIRVSAPCAWQADRNAWQKPTLLFYNTFNYYFGTTLILVSKNRPCAVVARVIQNCSEDLSVPHQRIQKGSSLLSEKLRWEKIAMTSQRYTRCFCPSRGSFWTQTILIPIPNHITINLKYNWVSPKSLHSFSDISTTLMMPLPLLLSENIFQPRAILMCV